MLLRDLLRSLPEMRMTEPADDVDIADIAYDSRLVQPGWLFVAVPKVGGDAWSGGYEHIGEALHRGAAAVVAQVQYDGASVPIAIVPDARGALADLAGEFFGHPSRRLHVFAVTGTDGKTTTTHLLEQILSAGGFSTGLIGTVEIAYGGNRTFNADRMTTPESLDLQRLLRAMAEAGVTHVALEASSHALVLNRLRGMRLAACAVTNITADHIEFHGTWDAYFGAKASLFSDVGRGSPAILNRDDPSFQGLARLATGRLISYGFEQSARVRAMNVAQANWSTRCTFVADDASCDVTVPLPGRFNVSNALGAAGLALAAGLPLEAIAGGISGARPPLGRMQRVVAGQDFDILVDYAHTPHAFRSVLSDLRSRAHAGSQVIAVFGAAGNRDRGKRPMLAQIAREYADFFIITNEDPFGERPDAIISEVASGVPSDEEGVRFVVEPDRHRAIEKAIRRARSGDVVAILGKGHEQSIVANGNKEAWNDSRVVRQILETAR
jgi:UDP-N-acetylmuramoyl-L-alanyl-D-glutamate--2,6-diaminopimelate ligase